MRKGLFFAALLATSTIGATALADRTESDNQGSRGQQIKEQVLQKQREGFGKSRAESKATNHGATPARPEQIRPRGEVYGDQATRSGKGVSSRISQAAGKNMSASGAVNTPSEIRAMRKMINPMYGAYRQAAGDGTDSYGGESMVPNGKGTQGSKNMSATGAVNTPSEIRGMLKMINPMYGAYRVAAGDGTDSYGGRSLTPAGYHTGKNTSATTSHPHFKNDKGEVQNSTRGNTATAMRNRELAQKAEAMLKAKMAQKANIAGK